MKKRRQSMMAINYSETGVGEIADERRREISMILNECCTCPKPLRSVLDVCRWRILAEDSSAYHPTDSLTSIRMKQVLVELDLTELPMERRPVRERKTAKESFPLCTNN